MLVRTLELLTLALAALIAGGWVLGIRRLTRVTPANVNIAMLFCAAIAYVLLTKASSFVLLWLLPVAWMLGSVSFLFPFSLLCLPGKIFHRLCMLGVRAEQAQSMPEERPMATVGQLAVIDHMRRLAEGGDGNAQCFLGRAYSDGEFLARDHAQAAGWYLRAAEQGIREAQFALGSMLADGVGVERDDGAAVRLIQAAADQGLAEAEYAVGVRHAMGRGLIKDTDVALKWIRRAAEKGLGDAQMQLGLSYVNGLELEKDLELGYMWLLLAAKQEVELAESALERFQSELTPDQVDRARRRAECWVPSREK